MAFTEEQTARLTGLTVHQLRHWARSSFFAPEFADDSTSAFSRVYSFSDLVSLQVLKVLRIDMGCSLQHLREVKAKLSHLGDEMWSRTTLYVLNRQVVFRDDKLDELREPVSGQIVMELPLKVVKTRMRQAVDDLNRRDSDDFGHIERKRNVSHNAAVIAGTRIPVASVRRLAEDGYNVDQILAEYPSLTEADIKAALDFDPEKHAA
jgi:uncharacterized protein (DUF433 family)